MNAFEQRKQIESLLGQEVDVTVDRPIGFLHGDIVYPVNYGYLPDRLGGDGEPQDAYILGEHRPLNAFHGIVIGGVVRSDDEEYKLVVAPEGVRMTQAQIAERVHFAERYFRYQVESLLQKSCGAVVCRRRKGRFEFLLLLQRRSHTWSFPKGHMKRGESEEETAVREIYEETDFEVRLHPSFRGEVVYPIASRIEKQVVLFLTFVEGEPKFKGREIAGYRWIAEDRILEELAPQYRAIMSEVLGLLHGKERSDGREMTAEGSVFG